jgi:hypothetical protein
VRNNLEQPDPDVSMTQNLTLKKIRLVEAKGKKGKVHPVEGD